MRRSLADHARERMFLAERRSQLDDHIEHVKQALLMTFQAQPQFDNPDVAALRQRAERAERVARSWHRLSLVLAVCAGVALVFA